jgi:hypothetical protein
MNAYAKFKKNSLPYNNGIVQMERKRQGTSAPAPTCWESPAQPTEKTTP